jgi:hypothetical protein
MRRLLLCGLIVTGGLPSFPVTRAIAQQIQSTSVAGGGGGRSFSDLQAPVDGRVVEVRVQAGDMVDSVQLVYSLPDGRSLTGPRHGGSGGRLSVLRLDQDEYIIGISGRYGDNIDSIRIHTNKRTSEPYGGRGGNRDYRIDVPAGYQAVGFAGRAGSYLDAIGLIYTPVGMQVAESIIAGGRGGTAFSDSKVPLGARVAEVRLWIGDFIDAVQMTYVLPGGRILEGARHGGSGGRPYVFRLETNEYITGISGRYGDNIDSLVIQTNRRTSQSYGGRGGSRNYRISVPAGYQAVGFTGRAGQYLDAIGLTYASLGRARR